MSPVPTEHCNQSSLYRCNRFGDRFDDDSGILAPEPTASLMTMGTAAFFCDRARITDAMRETKVMVFNGHWSPCFELSRTVICVVWKPCLKGIACAGGTHELTPNHLSLQVVSPARLRGYQDGISRCFRQGVGKLTTALGKTIRKAEGHPAVTKWVGHHEGSPWRVASPLSSIRSTLRPQPFIPIMPTSFCFVA